MVLKLIQVGVRLIVAGSFLVILTINTWKINATFICFPICGDVSAQPTHSDPWMGSVCSSSCRVSDSDGKSSSSENVLYI